MGKQDENYEKDRDALIRIKEKSEDDFDKNITYISAGALALSLTLIDKVVDVSNSICKWCLIVSWSLFTASLLLNLVSHYVSSLFHDKTIEDVDNKSPCLMENFNRRNKIIRTINIVNILLLIGGVIFVVIYSSVNI